MTDPTSPDSLAETGPGVREIAWWILAPLCLLSAFQTFAAVYLKHTPAVSYTLYFVLKAAILAAPVLVWRWQRRRRAEVFGAIGLKRTRGLSGLVTGAILSAPILLGYYFWLQPTLDPAPVLAKCRQLNVDHFWGFWGMAGFISFSNSLLEEYYWRGFILEQLRRRFDNALWPGLLAGVLFGLHHVFLLISLMGWGMALFCTFGTVVAGWVWSWQRLRGHSLWDCYLSHILADLAGLWVGWDMVRRAAAAGG